MAYWQRDRKGYVFVFTRKDGKPKKLPRKDTKHLDSFKDSQIQYWVDQYTVQFEGKSLQKDNLLFSDSTLKGYLEQYLAYLTSRKKSIVTIKQHRSMLTRFGIEYFLKQSPAVPEPYLWPYSSIKLMDTLQAQGVSAEVIFRTNVALRGVFNFLQEEGIVDSSLKLRLRTPLKEEKTTSLNFQLKPEQVLALAKRGNVPSDVKFMALAGYFFSLRPQEVFSLQKQDFRAGSKVLELDCSKAMARVGYFSKFAVKIQRPRTGINTEVAPKKGSSGWVSCFNAEASKLIVLMLNQEFKDYEPDQRLINYNNRELYKRWLNHGIEGITLKDLRRASLYHLGHFSELSAVEVMKHARHQRIETTMNYLRRPEEEIEAFEDQFDLEA